MYRLLPLLLLTACSDSFAAPDPAPAGAYRIEPNEKFTADWQRMEDCSGIRGDMARITWYAVPGYFPTKFDSVTAGLWVHPHTIYIVETALTPATWGPQPTLIAHEMLHDLLQRGDHPPVFTTCRVR